jgi:hypothetical protein
MEDPRQPDSTDLAFQEGCRSLGEIVYFFQQLEDDLRNAVSFLIDPDDPTAADIVVCEQSFKQLVALADSLFKQFLEAQNAATTEEWHSILKRALDAEGARNALLHSTYGVTLDEAPAFCRNKTTAKFKRGFHVHVELLDEATMTAYRQKVSSVANDILDFMCRVFPKWNTRDWQREPS